ncbi:MAG: hypothetical protein IT320_05355 [Anaerolineae bacterium]|nr:hypothetical protein [Anaerolineae bacterium]
MDDAESSQRDDHLYPITRALAIIIVPILTVAFGMLYLFPERTEELFAWPLRPSMSAMMLGAAYLGGAYFFTRVALAKQWHTIALGLLPVSTFAGFLGVATLIHWDRFTPGHVSFLLWAFLYLTLPFVIAWVWSRNRATDPHMPDADYPPLPTLARRALMGIGALLVVVSLLLFLLPDVMIPTWPWTLSPLTARVMAALFILPGIVGLGIGLDGRWSAARIILQAQIGALVLILLALVFSRADVDWSRAVAWMFAAGMVAITAILIGVTVMMERRRARPN